jgi:transglutaminase-like putative cysteine protease
MAERVTVEPLDDPGNERAWLQPTYFLDWQAASVLEFARRATEGETGDRGRATRLFYAVRDGLRYDPYSTSGEREHYRASAIVHASRAFCVPKAILLTAAARAVGIPARLGFADVRNHLATPKLLERMGTDVFVFHGYSLLRIDGQWRKAAPTFNRELCERFGVHPLEFDGSADALLHPFDREGRRHMEYVRDRGVFDDLPLEAMMQAMRATYGDAVRRGAGESETIFEGS